MPTKPPEAVSGRMQVNKPTLVGEDPLPAEESTRSTLTRRARILRRAQIGIVAVALAVALWALLSTPRPHSRGNAPAPAETGTLNVTLQPADALLLLDGAQVKDARDPQWTEQKLAPGDHVLTVRREGYSEQAVPVSVVKGEVKNISITLSPVASELTVLSSPPGAQVWLDGVRKGVTPAFLPNVDPTQAHAVTVEKRCYRAWQVAVPVQMGRRELAATLQPEPGACPGAHLEKSGMPAPADVPDDAAAQATLGFLSLGSRPSASVVIDGVDIGMTTPLLAWPLKNGSHRVRLVADKRASELDVDIRTGETHSEIVNLAEAPPQKRGRR
jgi:hypothetical protein